MSTHSRIGVDRGNGMIESIYCHFDGYLRGVGRVLLKNYTNDVKVDDLMKLGDISSIGSEIGEKHDFVKYDKNMCNSYGRDRDEDDVNSVVNKYSSPAAFIQWAKRQSGAYYVYLWRDGKWWYNMISDEIIFKELTWDDVDPEDK